MTNRDHLPSLEDNQEDKEGQGGDVASTMHLLSPDSQVQKHAYQQRQTVIRALEACFVMYSKQQEYWRQQEAAVLYGTSGSSSGSGRAGRRVSSASRKV